MLDLGAPPAEITPETRDCRRRVTSMRSLKRVFRLKKNSSGQTMVEYALILVTVAVVAAALFTSASTILETLLHNVVMLFGL
jgi:Flp pilus assembly pilin Flp